MSDNTAIGWTDSTWNPLTGCTRVSSGCTNCYAERTSARLAASSTTHKYIGVASFVDKEPRWSGAIEFHPDTLEQPLRWTKPRRVFVCSMSDLFHPGVKDDWLLQVFDIFRRSLNTRDHVFQVLTKRPERMAEFTNRLRFDSEAGSYLADDADAPGYRLMGGKGASGLTNVWLGVSAEDQATADQRIPSLLMSAAAVRFVSYEPALGPVELKPYLFTLGIVHESKPPTIMPAVDWVIAGGESGPGFRPADPAWFEDVHTQCLEAGTAFFMKQDSGPRPGQRGRLAQGLFDVKQYPVPRDSGVWNSGVFA